MDEWDSVSNDTPPASKTNDWDTVSSPQPSRKRPIIPDNLVLDNLATPEDDPQTEEETHVTPSALPHQETLKASPRKQAVISASFLKKAAIFGGVVLLLLASSFGVFEGISIHNANVAATATAQTEATASVIYANATATVQVDATGTAQAVTTEQQIYDQATGGTPAFEDALTDNRNGWATFNASWGACGFTDGAYHFTLNSGGYWNFCNNERTQNLNNFALQVQVNIVQGNDGGIVFGSTANSYYRIYVDSGGTYTLYQYTKSNDQTLTLLSSSSPAIKTGLNQDNVVTIIVNNSSFYFYANNQFVTSSYLSVYNAGTVSLTAASTNQATDVIFSNLETWTF